MYLLYNPHTNLYVTRRRNVSCSLFTSERSKARVYKTFCQAAAFARALLYRRGEQFYVVRA